MTKKLFLSFSLFLLSFFFVFGVELETVEESNENPQSTETLNSDIKSQSGNEDPYIKMGYIPSNAIGQEQSEGGSGYYIDRISDAKWYLLKDGNTIKTYELNKDGKYMIRTETDNDGKSEIYKYDDRGNLVSYKNKEGEEETLVYDNALHLVSSSIKLGDYVISEKTYYRNPQTGAVLAIKDNDRFSFFSSSSNSELFVVGNDDNFDTYETFFGSVTYRMAKDSNNNTFTATEDDKGNLTITYEGGKTTYSKDGRIAEDNGVKYFYYDSGILNYTEKTENDTIVKEYYEDASVVMREELNKNEELLKKYTYSSDEIKLELYEKSKPYAIITYAGDGVRVLDVRYL